MSSTVTEPAAPVVHDDVATRVARGRARRKEVPRAALGEWRPATSRPDPIVLLHAQEETRVPELVPLRHERMLASPFTFYRGAAVIMAADLGSVPQSGLWVQCCGDAHLSNFGGFASPERSMLFDINDFDETSRGPFEWDLKRLAASFEIAGRSRGLSEKDLRRVVLEVGQRYRLAMNGFAQMANLAIWYSHLDIPRFVESMRNELPNRGRELDHILERAQTKDNLKAFQKLTRTDGGNVRFVSDPPLLVPMDDLFGGADHDVLVEWLHERVRVYRRSLPRDRRHLLERYRLVDFARKVVGVGSIGTRCWVALLLGRDNEDPLFLQIKEAEASVLEPYAGKSGYGNCGQRVVEGQRLVQAASDIMLGWLDAPGIDGVKRDYYVRQLWDWKLSPDVEAMARDGLRFYADICAWTLARAHAVSGDPIAIASYVGGTDRFDTVIADFAAAYADQNERDFESVSAQAKAGLFELRSGTSGPSR